MTTATTPEKVRSLAPADVGALAETMARAFYDDPVIRHCLLDESRRMRRMRGTFELFMRRLYALDDCRTTAGLSGGALWVAPGKWKLGTLEQLSLTARMARIHGRALPRVLQVLACLEARHPHEPHWYLNFLGVDPALQGQGIGSALLRPALERCDRERVPAYLEASSARNRVLYERHGFEVSEEVRLPAGGPPMWLMWREAGR